MTIKITTDSTCDLSKELLDSYDIAVTALYIIKRGQPYRDGIDITPAEIFKFTDATGEFCTTAAVSTFDYTTFFEKYAADYDAVIHVSLGSGFSLCYANAVAAAGNFKNVHVVDSANLSSGQGHVVLAAAEMAREGLEPGEILRRLADLTGRVETSFLIDRLDYIYKGGRCSLATAMGANILHLRTCVAVAGGKMQVVKKYRGSFPRCVDTYVRDRLSGRCDLELGRIFITHPAAGEDAVAAARAAIRQTAPFEQIIETRAGCTISAHCGPKTLGILFIRK